MLLSLTNLFVSETVLTFMYMDFTFTVAILAYLKNHFVTNLMILPPFSHNLFKLMTNILLRWAGIQHIPTLFVCFNCWLELTS